MAPEEFVDHAEWPRYWLAIRFAAVSLLVAIVIVGGAAFLPRPESLPLRIVIDLVIAGIAVAITTSLARRIESWRKRRSV